jgi:hypothetical protein
VLEEVARRHNISEEILQTLGVCLTCT